jgi:hypothetical protein
VAVPVLIRTGVLAVVLAGLAACSAKPAESTPPDLAPRGTVMTTAKPTRQDLDNRLSLSGKVTLSPVFGLVAPVAGKIRYLTVSTPKSTPTKPTKVANIWVKNKATKVEVPAGATFAGRLVDNGSTVLAGMPIVSAKFAGYGIVADIDGSQAYKIVDNLSTVRAQITSGPGPFSCKVLGTIAALPAGTVPDEPAPNNPAPADPKTGGTVVFAPTAAPDQASSGNGNSDATGMRLVCVPPKNVKLINGASATIEVITARATNVLVLPVEAVAGTQGKGQVEVVKADGSKETREVVLGLTDGKVIEIKSGLTEEETVAVPGPNLPAAAPGDGSAPGMK